MAAIPLPPKKSPEERCRAQKKFPEEKKNDHFREMLARVVSDKQMQARTVLFDSWQASADNLK